MELWPVFILIFIVGLLLMGWIRGMIEYGRDTAWERQSRDISGSLRRGKRGGE